MKKIKVIGTGSYAQLIKSIINEQDELKFDCFVKLEEIENIKNENCFIGIGENDIREKIFLKLINKNVNFVNLIHKNSYIAQDVKLGKGILIQSGVIINPGSVICDNVIINTNSSVDHHCKIYENVHVAPGVTICGNCEIEKNVFIGAGSTIINRIRIKKNSLVGSGSNVVRNVDENKKVYGNPAKNID